MLESIALFAEDIGHQEQAGFCKVFTWDKIQQLLPKNLKISPLAVVPQVGRRGRIILDLSFPVYQELDRVMTITQPSINDTRRMMHQRETTWSHWGHVEMELGMWGPPQLCQ
jgi:hypothetical protein